MALGLCVPAVCFGAEPDVEWRHHGRDKSSARYSPLSQIDAENFSRLEVAWRWESADKRIDHVSPYERRPWRATPLMVGGRIYVPTELSQVAALDAATGEELWVYDPKSYARIRRGKLPKGSLVSPDEYM